ncbi:MAG TPA: outer membrane protein assembly factor BamD [Edaphobacter sp.]|nr:outer membrane protein assembly factor BamD [Edaphobacter sp.]
MNNRSFFPNIWFPGVPAAALAGLIFVAATASAQVTGSSQTTTGADGKPQESITLSAPLNKKKDDKVVQSKDTKQELRKEKKIAPVDAGLPDKVLYDKAVDATKRGHFDVARLDLQTLLNTYPDSQYQMKAKLAIADSWYKEGGTAALTQAEQEYKDFITFFPNVPEAAEAQMRVGDIYFRQMDKPDRDYSKAVHAEEEYRLMLQQFPESTLVPQAKQRLREVQEVMASRESEIAAFYATHSNWAATIARYQTVVDTYPQYSRMDDVLIGLGDAYETEARFFRSMKNLPEAGKARLEKTYDDLAIAAYSKVILEHSASSHVEDARDRLDAMNVPIPAPTPAQVAASLALENSRRQYRLQDRAILLVMHRPDTVPAARDGDPTLSDPTPTLAPHITNQMQNDFKEAFTPPGSGTAAAPTSSKPTAVADSSATAAAADAGGPAASAPAAPAAPLQFQDVPKADAAVPTGSAVVTNIQGNTPAPAATGNSMGVEILTPGANTGAAAKPAADGGLKAVGPENAAPLPAAEKPAAVPDQVNDIDGKPQPAAQTPNANGKNPKPEFDKSDESSSKHKKKKGLSKLNPF